MALVCRYSHVRYAPLLTHTNLFLFRVHAQCVQPKRARARLPRKVVPSSSYLTVDCEIVGGHLRCSGGSSGRHPLVLMFEDAYVDIQLKCNLQQCHSWSLYPPTLSSAPKE